MGEKCLKVLFISFNVLCMIAGVAMFAGGLFVQYLSVAKNILRTIQPTVTETQMGAIGVGLIALGALVLFISFVGCCGAVSESRCLLSLYFFIILLLFIGQLALSIATFVYGYQSFVSKIEIRLRDMVFLYGRNAEDTAILDWVQGYFQCCGYNGTSDYRNYVPTTTPSNSNATIASTTTTTSTMASTMALTMASTMASTMAPTTVPTSMGMTTPPIMASATGNASVSSNATSATTTTMVGPIYLSGKWPSTCCKKTGSMYVNETLCHDNSLPLTQLEMYLNTKGCTSSIENFVRQNLIMIAGVAIGIAFVELLAMITACCVRKNLD